MYVVGYLIGRTIWRDIKELTDLRVMCHQKMNQYFSVNCVARISVARAHWSLTRLYTQAKNLSPVTSVVRASLRQDCIITWSMYMQELKTTAVIFVVVALQQSLLWRIIGVSTPENVPMCAVLVENLLRQRQHCTYTIRFTQIFFLFRVRIVENCLGISMKWWNI